MDLKPHSHPHPHEGVRKGNPLSKLNNNNPKETSDFAKKDATKRNVADAPSTPGRPVFSFSVASRKNPVPSKWNDAEKWLISDHHHSSTQNQHLHGFVQSTDFVSKKSNTHGFGIQTEEKVSIIQNHHNHNSQDKFSNEVLKLVPVSESFLFRETSIKSRDIGTEMTPLGSSATSRCPTPLKTLSPPRHNTPATRSGPLVVMDALDIQECHLAKLKKPSGLINWSSREEEEEDISKSLRHFEIGNECRKSISVSSNWEEEEKSNCCLRYQREEAKIQAWVDLQVANAEAQSRKLEVKIQKMRSKLEEKLMRKMAIVHRKAGELRAAALLEHTDKIQKVNEEAKKIINLQCCGHNCGCFPCNNLHS